MRAGLVKTLALLGVIGALVAVMFLWNPEPPPQRELELPLPVGPPSFDNFVVVQEPPGFFDVTSGMDFFDSMNLVTSLGLISGTENEDGTLTFNGNDNMTFLQGIAVAVNVHRTYNGNRLPPAEGEDPPWYAPTFAYAREHGVLPTGWGEADNAINLRGFELAMLFNRTLPADALEAINDIDEVPGMDSDAVGFNDILSLMRAGVLTPDFEPMANVTRGRGAAIYLARLVDPERREEF